MLVKSNSPQPAASPQLVGREFVRQYYTMMGEAPKHVYRFYSNESVYVFNGSEPVIGQQAVSDHIESLNLKDCHTKIRVVDAHETLNRGVVVQVIGEISLNGGALRRFAQTFVLALQTEKKYYVHNDVFRYLDELFDENAIVHDTEAAIQDDAELDHSGALNANGERNSTLNGKLHTEELDFSMPQQPLPPRLNNLGGSSVNLGQEPAVVSEPTFGNVNTSPSWQSSTTGGVPTSVTHVDNESNAVEDQQRPMSKGSSAAPSEDIDEVIQHEGVKSWANRVAAKPATQHHNAYINNAKPQGKPEINKVSQPNDVRATNNYQNYNSSAPQDFGNKGHDVTFGNTQQQRSSPAPSYSGASGTRGYRQGGGRSSTSDAVDELQIFVGNLAENTSEHELRECFGVFGTVVDVKLRIRQMTAVNRPFPTFAFVSFESTESVKKVLDKPPNSIFIRDNHSVTVELKRGDDNKDGGSYGRGHRTDRDRMGDRSNAGPRGGGRGGGGPIRGSYRGGPGGAGGMGGRGGGGSGGKVFTPTRQHGGGGFPGGGSTGGHLPPQQPPGQGGKS